MVVGEANQLAQTTQRLILLRLDQTDVGETRVEA
tara:strand:+ start:275 stop:376 length:102 start_codon:yes stop_codon:yes gene_type:complete